METTFTIAESSLSCLANADEDTVYAFVDLVGDATDQGTLLVWEEVFSLPVDGYDSLSDFLYGSAPTLDRDSRLLLGRLLDKALQWGDDDGSPACTITDGRAVLEFAPSVGIAMERVSRNPYCVLSLSTDPIVGFAEIWSTDGEPATPERLWFVDGAVSMRRFWRHSFEVYAFQPNDLDAAAWHAFPKLVFAPGVWSQVDRFEGSWLDVRPRLIRVLSGLNDGMASTYNDVLQNHERTALMSSKYGVDCSPESPNTHRNAAAMRQRRARFADGERTCEWHAKLEPHRNRVHYVVEGDFVYVGIFARHLL